VVAAAAKFAHISGQMRQVALEDDVDDDMTTRHHDMTQLFYILFKKFIEIE